MKKFLTAHLISFRNALHYEFMVVFHKLLVKFPAVMAVIVTLFPILIDLLMREEQLINAMRKSDFTEKIANADHRVDRSITGMRELIASALRHFDPAVVDAAKSIYNRFAAFGNIAKKSYEEETAYVNLLIADLNSAEYAGKAALVGLTPWIAELTIAESEFEDLLNRRNIETADKPQGSLKEVRSEIDKVYHQIIERIGAAAIMDDADTYTQFIKELNAEIAYFNDHAHQQTKKDLAAKDATNIPPVHNQVHTGKPLTPVPAVYYRAKPEEQAAELAMGTDFSVTYKDNTNVGTAWVTVHGKGAYKGDVTVSFTIIEGN